MKEFERKQLIERVERESATVGTSIPETITVQGEPVDLHEFVFEVKRRETIPEGERERVERAKRNLRRERLERKERLETGEVSFEEGKELAQSVIGIDRALEGLESLRDPDSIEQEASAQEAADQKRWMDFLQQVLGHKDVSSSNARV